MSTRTLPCCRNGERRAALLTVHKAALRIACGITFIVLSLAGAAPAPAADVAREKLLPAPACAEGWSMDGKVAFFDKDSLFERINGESELYFPYGFTVLAYARYASAKDPQVAIDADVYAMGSPLDAFGIFANYRRKDSAELDIGSGAVVSTSQLLFYQGSYYVRLQVTGALSIDQDILVSCGRAIARNLPQNAGRPGELGLLSAPAVLKGTERYIAQGLLGYEFFRRGLIADALLSHDRGQVFVVLEGTPEAARAALEQYLAYLNASDKTARIEERKGVIVLSGIDPLYGAVYVEAAGRYLVGAVRFKGEPAARQAVGQITQQAVGGRAPR
jgi:hypothetical protein